MAAAAYTPANIRPLQGALLRPYTAGGSGELGNSVYIASDGDVEVTDANVAATAKFHGIAVAINKEGETAFVAGDKLDVCVLGPVSGYSSLTPGARLFVDEDAGKLDETVPAGAGTWTKSAGYAESAGVVFVMPDVAAPSSNS